MKKKVEMETVVLEEDSLEEVSAGQVCERVGLEKNKREFKSGCLKDPCNKGT